MALAGAGPGEPDDAPEPIRALSIACEGPADALWAAILDELCPMAEEDEAPAPASLQPAAKPRSSDIETALEQVAGQAQQVEKNSRAAAEYVLDHLAQVLDPEERAALAADFEDPGVPVATKVDSANESPGTAVPGFDQARSAKVQTAPASSPLATNVDFANESTGTSVPGVVQVRNETVHAASSPPLQVFDLEVGTDRAGLWQVVEQSICGLSPRSALLDAKPPMPWATDTCLSIDAAGRIGVWTLYRDGTSWFALREWANEHRNLLALTRRDLVVDQKADVAVHIVLPLDHAVGGAGEGPDVLPTLLRTAARNIYLYRLRQIQWNGRRGLLVVPIS